MPIATLTPGPEPRRRRGPAPVGKANIRDVARHAGVSVATVSRVLAGGEQVKVGTKARVESSMAALDFVINGHARALGGRGTPMIAFVLDDIFGPSFAALARGIEQVATDRSHLLLMATTHRSPEREAETISMLQEQRPAAVVWLGPLYDDPAQERRVAAYAETLAQVGTPFVICARGPLPEAPHVSTVDYDNFGGGLAITQHLIGLGHREILFAGAQPGHHASRRRLEGYLSAMTTAGLPTPSTLHPDGDFGAISGRLAVQDALAAGTRFTAVAGVVDSVALSASQTLTEAGFSIPGDFSVTGFDDINPLPGLDLGLSSVHVPFEEMGRRAVEVVLGAQTSEHVTLPVTVHARRTSGPVSG